jgi:hypothetical protein
VTLVPFVRPRGGDEIRVRLDADERGLLTDLVGQLVSLLENGDEGDPALAPSCRRRTATTPRRPPSSDGSRPTT